KPTPSLSCLTSDKKGGKVFSRSFSVAWYKQHSWLCGSYYLEKLFCWPCLVLGHTKSVWSTEGYCDFKNLARSLQRHELSKEHIRNHFNLKNLEKNSVTIVDALSEHGKLFKKHYNENVRLNRLFMEHIIEIVIFLAKQELAFRGHDESSNSLNKGNYKELFEIFFSRCSLEIKNHYKSIQNKFSGLSKIIQNDLITCISEYLFSHIKQEIKQCMFYSVQIDDTTDITQKTQCSIILRFVNKNSELVERFLGFHNVSDDHTAEGLFNLISSVLNEFDIEKKLVGQCYDGASVMAGHLTGLQARVKDVAPNAIFTHCLAHRLNLVLQNGCNMSSKCRIFFANLTGISAFFHNSTSRTNVVDSIVGKRIPQFVQTRWSSRSKILNLLVNEWPNFITVFDTISIDPKSPAESICGAIGHSKNLKKIKTTCDLIEKKRNDDNFLNYFNTAVELTKHTTTTRQNSKNELSCKMLFYEIIDNIIMQLNTRFSDTDKLKFLQLGDVTKFKEYSTTFPDSGLNCLKNTFTNIFQDNNKLKTELEVLYSDIRYHNLQHVYDLIKIFESDGLKEVMPEVYKLFALILTIPSTSVSVERSFSCLKRIKTYLRNSTCQQRLSSLSTISIGKLLIQQLKETEPFFDDVINMYASQKERVIDLIYKT
ncbi:hypothetical protein AGLY_016468, partial [Aphis glycines]